MAFVEGALVRSEWSGGSSVCCNVDVDLDGVRVVDSFMWDVHSEVRAKDVIIYEASSSLNLLRNTYDCLQSGPKDEKQQLHGMEIRIHMYACQNARGPLHVYSSNGFEICGVHAILNTKGALCGNSHKVL